MNMVWQEAYPTLPWQLFLQDKQASHVHEFIQTHFHQLSKRLLWSICIFHPSGWCRTFPEKIYFASGIGNDIKIMFWSFRINQFAKNCQGRYRVQFLRILQFSHRASESFIKNLFVCYMNLVCTKPAGPYSDPHRPMPSEQQRSLSRSSSFAMPFVKP